MQKIYGSVHEDNVWKQRYNFEVYTEGQEIET